MNSLDRTGKTLLFLLVVGVWGLLLRPLFSSTEVKAQSTPLPSPPPQPTKPTAISVSGDYFYLYQEGKLYVYGFEGAMKRRQATLERQKTLVENGFVDPSVLAQNQDYPFETKPNLLSTYELGVSARAR